MKSINLDISDINDYIVYKYLGYVGNVPDNIVLDIIKLCKQEVCNKAVPKHIYKVFDITVKSITDTEENPGYVNVIGTDMVLTGRSIVEHLSGCEKAVLLCATLGSAIDKYIKLCEIQDLSKAIIADAVASVAIDIYCDIIEKELKLLYTNKHFTFRFGLGYGDLPLELEPIFLNILDAGKNTGVCTNDSYILNPRKSVACIIGLSNEPIKKKSRGCVTCNIKESCKYRVRGEHCGF